MATTAPDSGIGNPLTEEERKNIKGAVPVANPVYTTTTSGGGTSGGNDAYLSMLAQIQAEQRRQAEAAYNAGKKNLDNARKVANKDAYITYMHGLKNMPQISAMSGTGGYAQSLINKQQLNYENNRADIRNNYMDNLRQLQLNRDNAVISANQDYLGKMASLIKSGTPTVSNPTTSSTTFAGKYNVGGKTMSRDEYLKFLAGYGMDAEAAAAYMASNNIPY